MYYDYDSSSDSDYGYQAHTQENDNWSECESCPRQFRTERACQQHMNDCQHWAPRFQCETCTKVFLSRNAVNQHMSSVDHWAPTVPCETCNSKFRTQSDADQHMRAKSHYRHYCKTCRQRFQNENNLRMHLNSKIHRGTSLPCPFCKVKFVTASGLSHHLETGSCPKARGLNRETILDMVRERDPSGWITKKQIEWHEEWSEYTATDQAYNGSRWECYLCHRTFKAKVDLNKHLNSPAHKQNIYHCPNFKCEKECVTLAALFNHLESESCAFMRFAKVQQRMKGIISGRNLISF